MTNKKTLDDELLAQLNTGVCMNFLVGQRLTKRHNRYDYAECLNDCRGIKTRAVCLAYNKPEALGITNAYKVLVDCEKTEDSHK